jgi:hypothetical protein
VWIFGFIFSKEEGGLLAKDHAVGGFGAFCGIASVSGLKVVFTHFKL